MYSAPYMTFCCVCSQFEQFPRLQTSLPDNLMV